jgi:hypothetical protein
MSMDSTVNNGQPVTYWMFRNLVSATQILGAAVVFAALVMWGVTDDNGLRVWETYTLFSAAVSDWGQQLSFPWD